MMFYWFLKYFWVMKKHYSQVSISLNYIPMQLSKLEIPSQHYLRCSAKILNFLLNHPVNSFLKQFKYSLFKLFYMLTLLRNNLNIQKWIINWGRTSQKTKLLLNSKIPELPPLPDMEVLANSKSLLCNHCSTQDPRYW